ncbi:MAG: CDP-archaeol synthase, partial [Pseudonocardia sp.]|nr:CDP-archaeol synthase [Pseudonocardia sp.]
HRGGAHRAPPRSIGRNLPSAIAVGVVLAALVLVPLFLYRPAFVVVVTAAIAIGVWELVDGVERLEARPPRTPLLAGSVVILALAWFTGPEALLVGLVLTVVAVLLWRLGDAVVGYWRDLGAATLIAVYVPFLAAFCVLLARPDDGALRVITYMATVAASDIGGLALGVVAGRHPMARSVSPHKTWEGFAGSVLAAVVVGAVLLGRLSGDPIGVLWQGAVFGLAMAAAATLGDLTESMIKRDLGLKDMGTLLPGHGGLMDRLDSMLIAAPVAYLLLTLFVPPPT